MIAVVQCMSVYKIPVCLLFGTWKEINGWLKRRGHEHLNEGAAANFRIYPNDLGGVYSIISLVRQGSSIGQIAALVHEVNHYAVYTFDRIGIAITDAHDEPFCYFVESIMYQCLTGIEKAAPRRRRQARKVG